MRGSKSAARGFTLTELLISLVILVLISIAVAGDISRTRYQAELNESARLLAAELRNLQARAFAATAVQTCLNASSNRLVCETSGTAGCVSGACDQPFPPFAVGATFSINGTSFRKFAEVDPVFENRREAASGEAFGTVAFLVGSQGSVGAIRISNLGAPSAVNPAVVVFERQTGKMRINACGTPPGAPVCGSPEPTVLNIVLTHSKINRTKTIRLNAITGKISID
jgi:prepilin-type N-terminal cleavage/methylation domain-containing protein